MSKTFDQQAQASLDAIDMEAAQDRLSRILGNEPGRPVEVPAKPRKPRSDKGVLKGPKAPDEIVLHLDIEVARSIAKGLSQTFPSMSAMIQDQIIAQLQKRLDSLTKAK